MVLIRKMAPSILPNESASPTKYSSQVPIEYSRVESHLFTPLFIFFLLFALAIARLFMQLQILSSFPTSLSSPFPTQDQPATNLNPTYPLISTQLTSTTIMNPSGQGFPGPQNVYGGGGGGPQPNFGPTQPGGGGGQTQNGGFPNPGPANNVHMDIGGPGQVPGMPGGMPGNLANVQNPFYHPNLLGRHQRQGQLNPRNPRIGGGFPPRRGFMGGGIGSGLLPGAGAGLPNPNMLPASGAGVGGHPPGANPMQFPHLGAGLPIPQTPMFGGVNNPQGRRPRRGYMGHRPGDPPMSYIGPTPVRVRHGGRRRSSRGKPYSDFSFTNKHHQAQCALM